MEAGITEASKLFYKLGQVLQCETIITRQGSREGK